MANWANLPSGHTKDHHEGSLVSTPADRLYTGPAGVTLTKKKERTSKDFFGPVGYAQEPTDDGWRPASSHQEFGRVEPVRIQRL